MNDSARPRRRLLLIPVVLVALLLAILAFRRWGGQPPEPGETEVQTVSLERPSPPDQDFVGSAVCRECHAQISDQYQSHPMAQSAYAIDKAPVVEDYETKTSFKLAGRTYRVEREAGRTVHEEIGFDPTGNQVYEQGEDVDFVIGSGRRGRSYVIDRNGWMYMSPISWYTQASCWDLSPGYGTARHPRFEREMVDQCLQCHIGRVSYKSKTSEDFRQYAQPPFVELAIGCERCHGPGQEHVELHRSQQAVTHDPIVNPEKLDPVRRDAVCNQCHLQGEYRILRYGRTDDDFRAGDHLGDVWSVFVTPEVTNEDGTTQAVSQVQQMQASVCFQESGGQLGCISCHDPHGLPTADIKHAFYRERCLQCHQQAGCSLPLPEQQAEPANGSCIVCHMPRLSASDVPHTSQTDHRVLRVPQPTTAAASGAADTNEGPKGPKVLELEVFDVEALPLSDIEEKRATGIILALEANNSSNVDLARAAQERLADVFEVIPDDPRVLDALAISFAVLGRAAEAGQLWEKTLAQEPQNTDALYALSVLHHEAGDFRRAMGYAQRFLAFNPHNSEMHGRLSHMQAEAGYIDLAIASGDRSRRLDPTVIPTYRWLADLYTRTGDTEQAEKMSRLARQLAGEETPQNN